MPKRRLLDLPDCVLSRVLGELAPAPDLFAVAGTCKRLRALAASDALSTIHVCPAHAAHAAAGRRDPRPPVARRVVATLAAALAAARPGDTVRLAPGPTHACPADGLVIDKPVRLVGGDAAAGGGPARCRVAAARRGTPTLTVAARRGGVAIHAVTLAAAPASPALLHACGVARVSGCAVRAAPCTLGHLHPPIASTAGTLPSCSAAPPMDLAAALCRPGGRLAIEETVVSGARGGAAVHATGGGRVRGVRAVPLPGGVLLWATVDAGGGGEEEEEVDVCATREDVVV